MKTLLISVLCVLFSVSSYADLSHRQGTVTIKVLNSINQPVAKSLPIIQTNSKFLFGSNNGSVRDWTTFGHYLGTFNSMNFLTFWSLLSGGPGQYDPGQVEAFKYLMNTFADNNLVLTAHPILYDLPSVVPPGVTEKDYRAHVKWWHQTFNRISVVDVLNEPYHEPVSDPWAPLQWSKEDAPHVQRRVNEYGLLTGQILDPWLKTLAENSDKYEVIGVQAHVPVPRSGIPSMDQMRENLRRITALGKPVHITEVSVPSANLGWTETSQEAFLKELYTMFFETPGVEAVYYWDLSDAGAWNPTSGLWRTDGSHKPAWNTINQLIKKTWNSSRTVSVPKTGTKFTGFLGTYTIDGKKYELTPGATWTIKLRTLR